MSAVAALLMIVAGLAHSAAASDSVTLGQTNLANIFTNGKETVQIPLTTTGTQVSWTCTDFYGAVTNGGPIAVTNGAATILPNLGRLGYFALHVIALTNGNAVATADTTFAVVAPVTVSTMGDSPFGVCTHFAEGWSTVVTPLIAKGGMALFRDEQYWATVETSLGQYSFSAFTPYMTAAASAGLTPLTELDFANSLYDGGYTPYDDAGNTGYANYGAALVNNYDSSTASTATPKVNAVEIWNEYNGSYYSEPSPTPVPEPTPTPAPNASPTPTPSSRSIQYTAMIKKAYPVIKAAQPNVTVVGGACVPLPIPWFEDLFGLGALPYMDAVDIHPYVDPPEVLDAPLATLQSDMAKINNGVAKPIWVTECGYTDNIDPGRQLMASYLVRLMTVMRADGVAKAFWYLLFDSDSSTSGLLKPLTDSNGNVNGYQATSGYPAYANLIQQLYGATFVQRETATDSRTRFYLFNRGSAKTPVHVLWSTASTAQLVLTVPANTTLTLINIMGEMSTLTPNASGQVAVATDINPVYVIGAITNIWEVGRDQLLADSIRDFGGTQGSGNNAWTYLYYLGGGNSPATCTYYNPYNFGQMAWTRTSAEYCWVTPGYAYPMVDATGAHPGAYGAGSSPTGYDQFQAVRRYTSNVAGTAHIVGYASLNNTAFGDGAGASIYVDGKLIARNALAPLNSVNFSYSVPISVGSNVDFVADCGPGTDYNYDYLLFRAQISVPVAAPTTFSAWQGQNFTAAQIVNPSVSGDYASPAGDNVPNLIKYAEGLNPNVPTTSGLPTTSVTTSGGMKYLTLSFRQATAVTDLTFTPQVNAGAPGTPSAWVAGGMLLGTPVNNGDGTQTMTYQDTVPMSASAPARFMRLSVTRQQ